MLKHLLKGMLDLAEANKNWKEISVKNAVFGDDALLFLQETTIQGNIIRMNTF
jgi:hypothetical protein